MDPEKYIDEITDSIMLEVEHGAFHVSSNYVPHNETKKIQENDKDVCIDRHHDIAIKNAQTCSDLHVALDLYKRQVMSIYSSGLPITDDEADLLNKAGGEIDTLIRSIDDPEFKSRRDGDRSRVLQPV
jgi:hypothetical protein